MPADAGAGPAPVSGAASGAGAGTEAVPSSVTVGGGPAGGAGRGRRRRVRSVVVALAATTVVAVAAAAATGAFGGSGSAAREAPSGPPGTAEVERTTLTRTETVDGTLGHGETSAVQAAGGTGTGAGTGTGGGAAGGAASGIVTWLPDEGGVIRRGERVYEVNAAAVPLLYGSTPLYRTLAEGSEGDDVELLEKNLSALGYTGFTADDAYTSGTAGAVRAWQEDLGRAETGEVGPGDAVVAPGARRVAEVKASLGGTAGGEVLTWTGTERVVSVDLDARYEDLVEEGTEARVRLPDGGTVPAEVSSVGSATAPAQEGGESGGASQDTALPVELAIEDQDRLGRYQAASVDVVLTAETREDVLAVPVGALVAVRGGGYAVEVVGRDGAVARRPVEPGLFADGMVEVSGEGITPGLVVGVPR